LWFSFDNRPAVAAFHGLMFGMVGDQRLKPLFGYTGFGLFQSKLLESGNVRIRGELTPEIPQFQFGDAPTLMNEGTIKTREDGSAPFILPWERYGDNMMLAWDYTHRYKNPVTLDKWPKAYTGSYINSSEHFIFQMDFGTKLPG
jgi:hypothetical protein